MGETTMIDRRDEVEAEQKKAQEVQTRPQQTTDTGKVQ